MIKLQTIDSEIILPNPVIGDSRRQGHRVKIKRSMNGKRFATVTLRSQVSLVLTFELLRIKAEELSQYVIVNHGVEQKLISYEVPTPTKYRGYITTNPLQFTMTARNKGRLIASNEEVVNVTLEFEGIQL